MYINDYIIYKNVATEHCNVTIANYSINVYLSLQLERIYIDVNEHNRLEFVSNCILKPLLHVKQVS